MEPALPASHCSRWQLGQEMYWRGLYALGMERVKQNLERISGQTHDFHFPMALLTCNLFVMLTAPEQGQSSAQGWAPCSSPGALSGGYLLTGRCCGHLQARPFLSDCLDLNEFLINLCLDTNLSPSVSKQLSQTTKLGSAVCMEQQMRS